MCGIFAYIGRRQALELLIAALKRLEYRGYDSAGVGIHGTPIKIQKKIGKVVNLEASCAAVNLEGTVGIAHTRWATHGKPSDANSHPHVSHDGTIAVVHNGVIENYQALKEQLKKQGYVFKSETDTECLAHLVQSVRDKMPELEKSRVIARALQMVEGAYGVVFIFQDDPDLLIGARKGSPLLLGVGEDEYMLGSDASAIIEHTKDVVYLREGDLVEIRRKAYKITTIEDNANLEHEPQIRDDPIIHLEMSLDQIEKGCYEHFMLKEIMDQPNALSNVMRGRLYHDPEQPESWKIKLGGLEKTMENFGDRTALDRLGNAQRIIICACGTSFHSGMIGKYVIESLAKLPVEVEYASEFRYRRPLISADDIMIAISQSGETADTLEAIKIAQQHQALTLGVVNVVGSSIARLTHAGVYLHTGPEIGVASTKAFTGQVMALCIMALEVAMQRETITQSQLDGYCDALNEIPNQLKGWLNPDGADTTHEPLVAQIQTISKYFRLASNSIFCGCGIHFPSALEGALKLKEISYIHAEGFPAAEIKHASLTLIKSYLPTICIAMKSDPAYKQVQKNIEQLWTNHAAVLVLTNEGNHDFDKIASFVIRCPTTKLEFEPIVAAIPLQLLAYYIAKMRGCSIDQPRNLAKSVTVE